MYHSAPKLITLHIEVWRHRDITLLNSIGKGAACEDNSGTSCFECSPLPARERYPRQGNQEKEGEHPIHRRTPIQLRLAPILRAAE